MFPRSRFDVVGRVGALNLCFVNNLERNKPKHTLSDLPGSRTRKIKNGWRFASHAVAMVLLWFWSVVAMRLLCHVWFCLAAFGVAEQAFFDLYMTSAPVGHVPRQPLVTGPHLHPSPASSPPSSPSTLPSSSQSSVTGPPRFFPSYPFHLIFFFFSQEESAVACLQWVFVCLV